MTTAIGKLLGLLRAMKDWSGHSVTSCFQLLIGDGATQTQIAKAMAWALEIADDADAEIKDLEIDDETRQGLLFITAKLREGLHPSQLNNGFALFFPALPQTILTLNTFLKLTGNYKPTKPNLAASLLADIEKLLSPESLADLDPRLADLVRRHLLLLVITLKNLDVFGVEEALAAYAELMIRFTNAMRQAPPDNKENKGWMDRLAALLPRLKKLNDAWETGEKLVGHTADALKLIGEIN